MEYFLEGIAQLRHWYIYANEKLTYQALMEHFLQGNIPLRYLLNAKSPFMSWQRSAFNEVNDWAQCYWIWKVSIDDVALNFKKYYTFSKSIFSSHFYRAGGPHARDRARCRDQFIMVFFSPLFSISTFCICPLRTPKKSN